MSGCKTAETTNEALAAVLAKVDELIAWADADAEHAAENDARATARDDRQRAHLLRKARLLLAQCER